MNNERCAGEVLLGVVERSRDGESSWSGGEVQLVESLAEESALTRSKREVAGGVLDAVERELVDGRQ